MPTDRATKKVKPYPYVLKFLYYVAGYSFETIGKFYGVSRETVRKWISEDDKRGK